MTGDRCRLLFLRPDGAKPAPCTKNLHVKGGDVLHRAPVSRPGGTRTQAPTQARSHAARCRPCRVSHPRPRYTPARSFLTQRRKAVGHASGVPPAVPRLAPRRDALHRLAPAPAQHARPLFFNAKAQSCRARLWRASGRAASRAPEGRAPRFTACPL